MIRNYGLALSMMFGAAGLVGCAGEPYPAVPPEASQVVKGGKAISFTAPHDGRIYLRDESDRRMVFSADIRRGQVARFDSTANIVTIDGKVAGEPVPNAGHKHSIFFEASDREDLADRQGDQN